MSDLAAGPGWWQASDGKWYPPKERDEAPAEGWWLASDGKWYPPEAGAGAQRPGSGDAVPAKAVQANGAHAKAVPAKAVPAKAVPAKAVPAKAVRAKAVPAEGSGAQGSGSRRAAGGPKASKTATAKSAAGPRPAGTPRRTHLEARSGAASPSDSHEEPAAVAMPVAAAEQIRIRDQQSQADAAVLAAKRSQAASRALAGLHTQMGAAAGAATRDDRLQAKFDAQAAAPARSPATPAGGGAAASAAPARQAPPAAAKATTPSGGAGTGGAKSAGTTAGSAPLGPLLEVRPSALSTDVEHIGERVAIFGDRVELRDRTDAVRRTILGDDITDVVVHRKITGAVLTIEAVTGPPIVARGLRPEQADDARDIIMRRTRPTAPADPGRRTKAESGPAPSTAKAPSTPPKGPGPGASSEERARYNEADLLSKLGDLYRAGILTTDEYEAKITLIGRLAKGELPPSPARSLR